MPNFAGYSFLPIELQKFTPGPRFLVVEEVLESDPISGKFGSIELLDKKNTVHGRVLAVGSEVQKLHNIRVGDYVVYGQWQGGRWSFRDLTKDDGEQRCLIMDMQCIGLKYTPSPIGEFVGTSR